MKKGILFVLVLMGVCIGVQAQSQQQIVSRIAQQAAAIKTLQCNFVQTKSMKLLGDKMVSRGKMYYQQKDKLHWEYLSPYQYTFILNQDRVLLRKGTRSDVIDVRKNKMFREIASVMMSSVVGNCLTDSKSFRVTASEDSQSYVCTLVPLKKEMKQMYQKIILTFSRKQGMIMKVLMLEKSGDSTEILLQNVVTNKSIPASVFAI